MISDDELWDSEYCAESMLDDSLFWDGDYCESHDPILNLEEQPSRPDMLTLEQVKAFPPGTVFEVYNTELGFCHRTFTINGFTDELILATNVNTGQTVEVFMSDCCLIPYDWDNKWNPVNYVRLKE